MTTNTDDLALMIKNLMDRVAKLERSDRPGGSAATSCAILKKSATQSVGSGTNTAITFDGEVVDTDNYHNNTTNNARLTAPADGYYLAGGSVEVGDLTDQKYFNIAVRKNGVTAEDGAGRTYPHQSAAAAAIFGTSFMRLLNMSKNDYVELMLFHDKGSTVTVKNSQNGTSFWIIKVG